MDDLSGRIDLEGALNVRLKVFEGPLDLLLHLIKNAKIDIYDIPIAEITAQYLEYLDLMRDLNLDIASEFLVVAATLAHIKSRMLLPVHAEGEQDEDPRLELVEQLLEYQRYKEASENLRRMQADRELVFSREPDEEERPREEVYIETNLFDLLTAFREIISMSKEGPAYTVASERFSVADRIRVIMARLACARQVRFTDLFEPGAERGEIIVTFLAILELIRLHMVHCMQTAYGGEIFLTPVESKD